MSSLYGSMLTRVENFRDFKIIKNSKQADVYTKRPDLNSRIIINEDLNIVEMNNNPILIGSIVLQNSRVLLFNFMYNQFPKLLGRKNMEIGYVDTDSIILKIKNMKNVEY